MEYITIFVGVNAKTYGTLYHYGKMIELIERLREQKGMSKKDFCEKAGLDPSHYSKVVKDKSKLSLEKFESCIKVLGGKITIMFVEEDRRIYYGFKN